MKRNRLIALFAGLSLALVSSVALAAPSVDTLLVAGYDSDQMAVLYGVSDIDQDGDDPTLDCTLVGDFVYELDAEADGDATEVLVTGLKTKDGGEDDTGEDASGREFQFFVAGAQDGDLEGGDVEFFSEDDEDRTEGTGVLYGTPADGDDPGAEECALTSVTIEPNGNGEINHGKVVSTFAKLLKGGNGCLIRHFAQSDFGKGDYDEVDEESFEVTLQSFETACDKKNKKDSTEVDDDTSSGDSTPGKNNDKPGKGKDNAPGQNKDKPGKGNGNR